MAQVQKSVNAPSGMLTKISQRTDQTISGLDSLIQFEQNLHTFLLPIRPVITALEQGVAYMGQQFYPWRLPCALE